MVSKHQLIQMVIDGEVGPKDMPRLFKYFENPDAPIPAYWDLFTAYIDGASKYELGMILEMYPNLPFSWKNMINRRLGLTTDPKEKARYLKDVGDMARKFRMMYGDRDKKLN